MSLALEMHSAAETIGSSETTLVAVVDGLLRHGVVLRGELWLTVADVDLVFLGVDVLLTTPDKIRAVGSTA